MIKNSLFWRFNTQENTDYSVIVGTIHLTIDNSEIKQKCFSEIDKYDRIYTETSLDNTNAELLFPHFLMGKGESWLQYMNRRQYHRAIDVFKRAYRVDLENYAHMRPLIVMSMIQASYLGLGSGVRMDQMIWDYGLENSKACLGIESIHEQMAILKKIPLKYDFYQFKRWSRHIGKMNKSLSKLIDLYTSQDISRLYQYTKGSLGNIRGLLLNERNDLMAERILESHNDHASFYSFGAGHLAGLNGVLNKLKQSGCHIENLKL